MESSYFCIVGRINTSIWFFLFVSDVLCGFSTVPAPLCPKVFRHPFPLRVRSVEQVKMLCSLHLHQPVLRLRCDAHHSNQLCLPCYERVCRRSRVSHNFIVWPMLLEQFWVIFHVDTNITDLLSSEFWYLIHFLRKRLLTLRGRFEGRA